MTPIPQAAAFVLHQERKRLRTAGQPDIPKLPCCTFQGRVLKKHFDLGGDPHFAETGGDPEGSSNWARLNSWPEAIAYTGDRWCAVDAVVEMGGLLTRELRRGRWHIGQCWSLRSDGVWRGDMYAVLVAKDGSQLVMVSDTHNGFRTLPITEEEWLEHLRVSIFGATSIERRLLVV